MSQDKENEFRVQIAKRKSAGSRARSRQTPIKLFGLFSTTPMWKVELQSNTPKKERPEQFLSPRAHGTQFSSLMA